MQWLENLFRGMPAASGAGCGAEAPSARAEHRSDESLGIDVAPAMAFTDTMPGYVRTIDLPSTAA
jgi:hypothetical protein